MIYVNEPGAGMTTENGGNRTVGRNSEDGSDSQVAPAITGWAHLLERALGLESAPEARGAALQGLIMDVGDLCSADAASIHLFNAQRELKHETSFGFSNRAIRRIEEIAEIATARQLLNIADFPVLLENIHLPGDDSTDADTFLRMLAAEGIVALASFPLIVHGKSLGFMTLFHKARRAYGAQETGNLSLLASVLAMALLNNQLADSRMVEDKGRDHFISALSHELRTPLTSIIGFTQVIRRRLANAPATDARLAEHMDVIWAQAQRLNRLIDTFVDIANIEQGDFAIKFGRVELLSVLKSAIDQMVARMSPTSEIDLHLPARQVWLRGDQQRLEQVFSHVVSNALRYSPQNASVKIICTVLDQQNEVHVSITDRGPGISEHLRDAIFERFYQAEVLRSGGLGVGLYLSKTIVEAHGGRILVESKLGEGTTICVILPI